MKSQLQNFARNNITMEFNHFSATIPTSLSLEQVPVPSINISSTTTPIRPGEFIPFPLVGASQLHEAGIRTHSLAPINPGDEGATVPRRLNFIASTQAATNSPRDGNWPRSTATQFLPIAPAQPLHIRSATSYRGETTITKPDFLATVAWMRGELFRVAGLSEDSEADPPMNKSHIGAWKTNVRHRYGTTHVSRTFKLISLYFS